jgi:hypothetical protein
MGWLWWWDSLSGPGPFHGIVYHQPLLTWTPDDPAASLLFDPSGLETNTNDFYIKFGVELGTLFAEENNLVYAPPFDAAPPDVKAYPLAGTVDFRVATGVELGGSIGAVRFAAGEEGFWKFTFGPRLIVRPLQWLGVSQNRSEFLQLKLKYTRVPGIEAAEFGAIGGPEMSGEWIGGLAITVNVLALK